LLPWLLGIALTTPVWAGTLPAMAQEASAASADAGSPGSAPAHAAAKEETVSFAARLDGWFGKYVVTPMETVLFYDFGTGPRYRERPKVVQDEIGATTGGVAPAVPPEIESRGWLRFGDQEVGTSVPFVVVWLATGAVFFT